MNLAKSVFAIVAASWLGTLLFLLSWGALISLGIALTETHPVFFIKQSFNFGIMTFVSRMASMPFIPLGCLLVAGLPLQALMQKHGLTSYRSNVLAAMACAAAVAFVACIGYGASMVGLSTGTITTVLVMSLGLSFWVATLAWAIRRPDRDVPQEPLESAICSWQSNSGYSEY